MLCAPYDLPPRPNFLLAYSIWICGERVLLLARLVARVCRPKAETRIAWSGQPSPRQHLSSVVTMEKLLGLCSMDMFALKFV